MTEKTWPDYVNLHSNLEGARFAFENDCEALFRKLYPTLNVQKVRANMGGILTHNHPDGGFFSLKWPWHTKLASWSYVLSGKANPRRW